MQPMSPCVWEQLPRTKSNRGRVDEAQKILGYLAAFEPDVARQFEREPDRGQGPGPAISRRRRLRDRRCGRADRCDIKAIALAKRSAILPKVLPARTVRAGTFA